MTLSKLVLRKDYQYPYNSIGWFVVAESKEIAAGQIITRKFSGHDIVIYRTASGMISIADAFCPHMGAHFGHGGTVEGEELKCPFHGFRFDREGSCTATGYGTKPSPRAKLRAWPAVEKFGLVFCFYHPEKKAPHYEIKDVDTEGWTDFRVKTWDMASNPVEVSENSVDVGHFVHIHGFEDPYSRCELQLDGPFLYMEYGFYRKDFLKKNRKINVEIEIYQQGLGFALVEAYVKRYDIRTRHLVMPVTVENRRSQLRIASSVRLIENPGKIMPMLKFFPKKLLTNLVARTTFKEYCEDVYADFKVWNNKIYVHPPALSKGDGPIMQYRQWAAQFDYELSREMQDTVTDQENR
jgi:nitrite reductase/ring-hydroxylating ferredoxin subunit